MTLVRPTGQKCGVVYKGRPPCRQYAGWGTEHPGFGPCKNHGGSTPSVSPKYESAMMVAIAMKDVARLGSAPNADPEQALLDLVSQAAGLVSWYGTEVERLAELEGVALWRSPNDIGYEHGDSLFGPEIDVDKDGTEHVVGEKLRGMVVLWNEERDRLAKYAKLALAAGIEKRRVEMAEQQGEQMVIVIQNVLVQLGMSPEDLSKARTLAASELRRLGSGTDKGTDK
jgi:hypothetical protein